MRINSTLATAILSMTLSTWVTAKETLMEWANNRTVPLCRAVEAKVEQGLRCTEWKTVIESSIDGVHTMILMEVPRSDGSTFKFPMVLQVAPKPNWPAKFAIFVPDLEKTINAITSFGQK